MPLGSAVPFNRNVLNEKMVLMDANAFRIVIFRIFCGSGKMMKGFSREHFAVCINYKIACK